MFENDSQIGEELNSSKYYKFKKQLLDPFANIKESDPLKDFDLSLGVDGHLHNKFKQD